MADKDRSKTSSITYNFLKLLLFAFITSALFFLILNKGGTALMESYFNRTDYMEWENNRRSQEFKEYVEGNQLSSTDTIQLADWVDRQSVVWLQIYRDHSLIYDSQFPYMKMDPRWRVEGQFYEWDPYYLVEFEDGTAEVFLTGMYTYQFYNYALIVEFFLSFLLFTAIIMRGIHGTMKYIRLLSTEAGILEGGNLDYQITVLGNDEMAVLARGLDSMRQSIRTQLKQEAELISLNQSIITSLSHDLRTPLTALLIYTEILENGTDGDRTQMHKWISKINEKAHQIKDMSDRILKYSLLHKTPVSETAKQIPFKTAVYDTLSETCTYLEQMEFHVEADLTWIDRNISVIEDYIPRILGNISSNIVKYAAKEAPIHISSYYDDTWCGLTFENRKRANHSELESTRIGMQNIRSMIEEMGGSFEIKETEEHYEIRLLFR